MKILLACRKRGAAWGYTGAVQFLGGKFYNVAAEAARGGALDGWDVILVDGALAKEMPELAESRTPLLLVDDLDGSQLGDRKFVKWPSVRAVLKRSCFTPPERNNEITGRWHVEILRRHGVKARRPMRDGAEPVTVLSQAELDKVYPLVGFGAHGEIRGVLRKPYDLSSPRKYATHFSGTTSYGRSEVQEHRIAAYQAAHDYPDRTIAHRDRNMAIGIYYGSMRESRTVLSPWGWGETCYRDFGAMAAGAVLIKPDMGHVATWPEDTFVAGETYLPCEPMFEDAGTLIDRVGRNWEAFEPMRRRARAVVERAHSSQAMGERLTEILEEVL